MKGAPAGRLLRLFSTAVVDQVLLSGASFLVGFLLIRRTSDFDYGVFVLVQSAITLLIAAQAAWLSGPLAVAAPAKPPELKRRMVGALEMSQRRFLLPAAAIALLAPVGGYLIGLWTGLVSLVIGVAIVTGWLALQREYLRGVLLIYSRPHSMLYADCGYAAVLLTGVAIAAFATQPAVLWAVVALAAAAWVGHGMARRSLVRDPGLAAGDASAFWREMRPLGIWATVGAVIYWLFSQSYNYVLASRVDLTAVADVNAARLILMPTIVLTVGVKTLLVPSAAAWLAESGLGPLVRRLCIFIAGIIVLDLIYFAIVWFTRDWLTLDLMHKVIGDRDRLLLLWGAVSLIGLVRDLLQTALFALHSFKAMAWLTAASAIVSLSLMWVGIGRFGPAGALIGQIAGETVNLAGVCLFLAAAHRRRKVRTHAARI
jgi:O-antigen/teichoic acid export membrane protein